MAKDDPKTHPKKATGETPFQKFERLARKVVSAPKNQVQERAKQKS